MQKYYIDQQSVEKNLLSIYLFHKKNLFLTRY